MTNDLLAVLREMSGEQLFWPYFWGIMWGLGGLTFGLTMRYLGMSLGMGVALGYCAAFGTLMVPPTKRARHSFTKELFGTFRGWRALDGRRRVPGGHRRVVSGWHVERAGNVRRKRRKRPSRSSISRKVSWWRLFPAF